MGAESTVAFAAALPVFADSLTHLILSNCSIDVEAAANALDPALAPRPLALSSCTCMAMRLGHRDRSGWCLS